MKKNGQSIVITDFFAYLKKLGAAMDEAGKLTLPAKLGTGYLKVIRLSPRLSIMLQQFTLDKAMTITRAERPADKDTLIFSFRNVLQDQPDLALRPRLRVGASVQVSTFDIGVDLNIPAGLPVNNLIIGMDLGFLTELISGPDMHRPIAQMISRRQPYLYEAVLSPEIQKIAAEVFRADADGMLAHYLYRIRAEELVYCFLMELLKRDAISGYPLNHDDVQRIYAIRDALIEDLAIPPQLDALAKTANMSVTKMGRLFRQIFGDSIYNYYQNIRMQHAAALLREKGLSVSEVGYQLGFSNLSHFSRLFEKWLGTKPKRYSKGG